MRIAFVAQIVAARRVESAHDRLPARWVASNEHASKTGAAFRRAREHEQCISAGSKAAAQSALA
jgi:hypothetical protein